MLATTTGHQPLPDAIEARLNGLEHTPPRSPSMPAWVWVSAVAAVVALIAIVLMN